MSFTGRLEADPAPGRHPKVHSGWSLRVVLRGGGSAPVVPEVAGGR